MLWIHSLCFNRAEIPRSVSVLTEEGLFCGCMWATNIYTYIYTYIYISKGTHAAGTFGGVPLIFKKDEKMNIFS